MVGRIKVGMFFLVVSLCFVNCVLADSGGYYIQQGGRDGIISIEAENYAGKQAGEENTWELTTDKAGFSGKGAVAAVPDKGTNEDIDYGDSPNTDYKVNFTKTGRHYVWVRGWGVDSGNSCHVDLDHKKLSTASQIDLAKDGWHWNNQGDDGAGYLEVENPGIHIVSLCMREDGAIVDKIILTTNPEYRPDGAGPVQSTKGGIISFESEASANPETVSKVSIPVVLTTSEAGGTYTVEYSITSGTAGEGDYRVKGNKLTFKPGETKKSIDIDITQDGLDEDDESFTVVLSNAAGPDAMLGSIASHAYTIKDPRPLVTFATSSSGVAAGEGASDLLLKLSNAYDKAVSVRCTVDGKAGGTVVFKPGQTEQNFKVNVPSGASGAIEVAISDISNGKPGENVHHTVIVCQRAYDSLDGAYYFRYGSGERWEKYARVGGYADAMVRMGPGDDRLVFWRGSSYLPFLDTAGGKSFVDVIVPQNGDGEGLTFDKTCKHAHIRIVENSPARAIVEWRYLPDFSKPELEDWTEEYYTVYPDGSCYRSIKTGTATLAEYEDPAHTQVQQLLLTPKGICAMPQSWIKPIELTVDGSVSAGFEDMGYDRTKGHYALAAKSSGVSGTICFTVASDVTNPALYVKGWGDAGVKVSVDGKGFDGVKVGYFKKMDNDDLVLWLGRDFKAGSKVVIEPVGGSTPVVRRPIKDPYTLKVPPFPESSPDPGPFGGFYTTLKYWKEWDEPRRVGNYADVVVQFADSIDRFIFWRGTTNVPHWSNEKNIWYENEFIERRGGDTGLDGCCEPMQDHDSSFSNVRILHSSPARAIVHWRYAPIALSQDIPFADKKTGWGDWVDEYYYVYPDESCVRDATLYTSAPNVFNEWHEAIPTMGPGQIPEDCLEMQAFSMANAKGEAKYFNFEKAFPPNREFKDGYNIILIGVKGESKPFAICESYGQWFDPISRPGDTRFNHYDDWPAWPKKYRRGDWERKPENQNYRSFCEFLPAHSSLMHLDWDNYEDNYDGPVIWLRKILLNGMTRNNEVKSLIPLTKYWENAPAIRVTGYGYSGGYFEKSQKAYHLQRRVRTIGFENLVNKDDDKHPNEDAEKVDIHVYASEDSPIINPCFVIDGWPEGGVKARLYMNGKEVPEGKDFRQGIETDWGNWDTKQSLVVWARCSSTEPIDFTIEQVK
ncbi:MAG TPA: Calx-beta domain-containing protein [Sedimentisphaerales bacterium]|nr:Calx-beta domain-containing protein [Sedimentisphaerales bacterium]